MGSERTLLRQQAKRAYAQYKAIRASRQRQGLEPGPKLTFSQWLSQQRALFAKHQLKTQKEMEERQRLQAEEDAKIDLDWEE